VRRITFGAPYGARAPLGTYPDTSLRLARENCDEARRRLAARIDPSAERQAAKLAAADTFEAIGREWLKVQGSQLSAATLAKAEWMLTTFVFPHIGGRRIGEIAATDVLRLLRRIESRGKHETAHRTRQRCNQILRFAVASGRAHRDVTVDLRGALRIGTLNGLGVTGGVRVTPILSKPRVAGDVKPV
jgi:integrase